ncbi:hypothetical protein KKC91_06900 [bacterium]|nr:hypothetical protein [bacterium]
MMKKARPERLVKRLIKYLNEGEITLSEAALEVGVSVQTIMNYRNKNSLPNSLIIIQQLERYLKRVERRLEKR